MLAQIVLLCNRNEIVYFNSFSVLVLVFLNKLKSIFRVQAIMWNNNNRNNKKNTEHNKKKKKKHDKIYKDYEREKEIWEDDIKCEECKWKIRKYETK